MVLTIPPKPDEIRPDLPPPGCRVWLVTFNDERRIIKPRIQLAHTNAAKNEGTVESARNWAERRTFNGKATTLPHFQVDRDGDACMLLELNRQPIVNAKANPFSLGYETADQGYDTDSYPAGSYFTEPQLQALCNIFAYVSLLFKIPLHYPETWDGSGSASHTEPFAYPYWSSYEGKACPGDHKKAQVRDVILPWAREIVAAWTDTPKPTPPQPMPKPEDEMTDADITRLIDAMTVDAQLLTAIAKAVLQTTINDGVTGQPQKVGSMIGWTRSDAYKAAG